jgi:hypothetical protein
MSNGLRKLTTSLGLLSHDDFGGRLLKDVQAGKVVLEIQHTSGTHGVLVPQEMYKTASQSIQAPRIVATTTVFQLLHGESNHHLLRDVENGIGAVEIRGATETYGVLVSEKMYKLIVAQDMAQDYIAIPIPGEYAVRLDVSAAQGTKKLSHGQRRPPQEEAAKIAERLGLKLSKHYPQP